MRKTMFEIKHKIIVMLTITFVIFCISSCILKENAFSILYTASINDNQDIYVSSVLSPENILDLTNSPDMDEDNIILSNDNNYLIYHSSMNENAIDYQDTSSVIYPQTNLLNINTKELINIGEYFGLHNTMPISSSSKNNYFVIIQKNTRKIYQLDSKKMILNELNIPSLENVELKQLKFSPDEMFIVYVVINKVLDPSFVSFIYDVNTGEVNKVGYKSGNCTDISWSATGDFFSVLCDISTDGLFADYHVYVYDFSERNIKSIKLIEDFSMSSQPAWSTDNDLLVMLTKVNGRREFLVFDPIKHTKEFIAPANQELYVFEIKWGFTDEEILYISGKDKDHSNIYEVNITDKKNRIIAGQESNYENLWVLGQH